MSDWDDELPSDAIQFHPPSIALESINQFAHQNDAVVQARRWACQDSFNFLLDDILHFWKKWNEVSILFDKVNEPSRNILYLMLKIRDSRTRDEVKIQKKGADISEDTWAVGWIKGEEKVRWLQWGHSLLTRVKLCLLEKIQ